MTDETAPVGIAVQRAVCAAGCKLPRELRHFVMVLAVLANRRTGVGLAGQDRIAEALGVTSKRTVQRLFADLEAHPASPVRVARKPRMRRSGRGRSSDSYQLELVVDQGDSRVALVETDQGDSRVAKVATTKATESDDQGDSHGTTKATPVSRDTLCDPRSDPRSTDPGSTSASPSSAAPAPAHELKLHYVAEMKRLRGIDVVFKSWARAMKAFAELATLVGTATGRQVISNALANDFAQRVQPWELLEDVNKHRRPPTRSGRRGSLQPETLSDDWTKHGGTL